MGFRDKYTRLASAQAFSASGATTDYLDGDVAADIGAGEPLAVVFTPTVAADHTTGDETYNFAIQMDSDPAFGTVQTIISSTVAAASLVPGAKVVVPIPPILNGQQLRYLRGYLTLGGTTPSITVTVDVVPLSVVQEYIAYPSGFVVK